MNPADHHLLLVDDDPISLKVMARLLEKAGFRCSLAGSAIMAEQLLQDHPVGFFSGVLLDNQMPHKSGLELLKEIKRGANADLPVIMQTGNNEPAEVQQCINAGAFYYLTKPLHHQLLLSVVEAAINDLKNHREVRSELDHLDQSLGLLRSACFQLRTPKEVKVLSALIARLSSNPDKVSIGLYELLMNAVEHGNLGITYDEKTQLIEKNRLREEIEQRLSHPIYADKTVDIRLECTQNQLKIEITDDGEGFDYEQYLEFSFERALDNHGRGIMMANKVSFDSLQYSQGGRCVSAIHQLI